MKKISLLIGAMMMAMGVFAAEETALPSYVIFSSTGPDKYADGTPALEGEVYALVWVADGATFEGLKADGTVINPAVNKLVSAAAIATGGEDSHCPPVMYLLTDGNVDLASSGSFEVYLLDTRKASQQAGGTTRLEATGVGSDFDFAAINNYSLAKADVKKGESILLTDEEAIAEAKAQSTVIPYEGEIPMPCIQSVQIEGARVTIKVTNTIPQILYGISAGDELTNMSKTNIVMGINGAVNPNDPLIFDIPNAKENRFFKVIRK